MILVCDKDITARAIGMRDFIFHAGFPCAVAKISEIADYLPIHMIVTFTDVFDDVRRTPYDNLFVLALGNGFVNSALNGRSVPSEEEIIPAIKKFLYDSFHIENNQILPFGVCLGRVFFSADFLEIYGNPIELTTVEYMIFKYLYAFSKEEIYFSAENIYRFCFPKVLEYTEKCNNTVSVHIFNLNQKFLDVYGQSAVKKKRFLGYRIIL